MKKIIIGIMLFILNIKITFADNGLAYLSSEILILLLVVQIFPFVYGLWIIFIIYKLIRKQKINNFFKIITIILLLPMIWLLIRLIPYYLTN